MNESITQPRSRRIITNLGWGLVFSILHLLASGTITHFVFACQRYRGRIEGWNANQYDAFGTADERVTLSLLALSAPLFGTFWTMVFNRLMRRYTTHPGHCSFCGWKLPSEDRACRGCGTLPRHACQNCGYNLTGNVSGTCPECGQHIKGEEATT